MGWYAWTLSSSNFFAPIICGFINDGLGYKWPFFIMAAFAGASFLFLFFFMEETNYDRSSVGVIYNNGASTPDNAACETGGYEAASKQVPVLDTGAAGNPSLDLEGKEKTFWQKIAILDKPRPFMMHWRAWQSIKLLSWPVVFYSGFSFGTYLIWFNILNATASVILGAEPYNFAPSIVGLTYISCMIGVVIG
jgi:MFS family permease